MSAPSGAGCPGETRWVFTLDADHVGIETFDGTGAQIAWSHHWIKVDQHPAGQEDHRLPGPGVRDRWAGWDRAPFTPASHSQVAVFDKLPQLAARAELSNMPRELTSQTTLMAIQNEEAARRAFSWNFLDHSV